MMVMILPHVEILVKLQLTRVVLLLLVVQLETQVTILILHLVGKVQMETITIHKI